MKTILILEDSRDRIAGFERAVAELGDGFELKLWRDAPSMMAECEQYFSSAALISLDYDLQRQQGATTNPGTGMDVARFLAEFLPVCPVLLHSSSTEHAHLMQNELRLAGWVADRVGPLGAQWIGITWVRRMRELISEYPNSWNVNLSGKKIRLKKRDLSDHGRKP
jgi:hypothetical protein